MSDETYPMRQVAHNKSALASLMNWGDKPKPLGFDPRLPTAKELEAAIVAHIGGPIQPAPHAETPAPAIAVAKLPAVGSRWRNLKNGLTWTVVKTTPEIVCEVSDSHGNSVHAVKYAQYFDLKYGLLTPITDGKPEAKRAEAPLPTPKFGEVWRRNRDGIEFICVSKEGADGAYRFCDASPGSIYVTAHFLNENYTRVPPKPAVDWQPIAEWDKRDKSKVYVAGNGDSVFGPALQAGWTANELQHLRWTHFAEITLPEAPK